MERLLYYTGIGLGIGAVSAIVFLFGVPRIKDPLVLTYKKDSRILNKILDNTNLRNLTFTTCYAGTVS